MASTDILPEDAHSFPYRHFRGCGIPVLFDQVRSAQKIRATRGTAFMTGSASNSLGMKYRRIVRLEGREVNWNLKLAFETA